MKTKEDILFDIGLGLDPSYDKYILDAMEEYANIRVSRCVDRDHKYGAIVIRGGDIATIEALVDHSLDEGIITTESRSFIGGKDLIDRMYRALGY